MGGAEAAGLWGCRRAVWDLIGLGQGVVGSDGMKLTDSSILRRVCVNSEHRDETLMLKPVGVYIIDVTVRGCYHGMIPNSKK